METLANPRSALADILQRQHLPHPVYHSVRVGVHLPPARSALPDLRSPPPLPHS